MSSTSIPPSFAALAATAHVTTGRPPMRYASKRVFIASIAVLAAVTLSGCTHASQTAGPLSEGGSTDAQGAVPTQVIAAAPVNQAAAALVPADNRAKGVLTVATDPTFAPYELYAADNKTVVGWDADFAAAIGQTLDLKIEMVPATFDTILPGLTSKKYDIGMSAFSVTPERIANADFVTYQVSGSGLAVAPGNPKKISMDPLTQCGNNISAQKGTTHGIEILPAFSKKCTDAGKSAITIQLFPSQNEANLALISGRADAVMSDSNSLSYQGLLAGGRFELATGEDYEPTPTGIALPKNSDLTPAISAAVKVLIADPVYTAINDKWGSPTSTRVTADQVDSK